jgi:anti-anti-sigma factor
MKQETILVAAELIGDAYLMTFSGRIDELTARQIPGLAKDAFLMKAKKLLLDMSNVPFISSAGLGVLVGVVRSFPGSVCVIAPQQYVRETLRMNRIDTLVKTFKTMSAFLREVGFGTAP